MTIQVAAIHFSHNADPASAPALKLRKNAFQTLPPVEWIRGLNTNAEDSAIAYTIAQVKVHSGRITIQAKFNITNVNILSGSVAVRAIQPPINISPDPWSTLLNTHNNILGGVKEHIITINANGETPFISFELENHKLGEWGIGIFPVIWFWQFRQSSLEPWETFDITQHKVYVLLNEPTLPFSQISPGDLLLPWTDILDFACEWAAGSTNEDEASGRITARLFNLGPRLFEYNCVNFLPAYVQVLDLAGNSFFNCTNFLLHLKTNSINRFIICSDCAAIVSTFANILGCDLWQSKMETPGTMFRVNRIVAIGGSQWSTPCGVPGFAYHEVAWKGNCTSSDAIFDACLAIDGTLSPFDLFRIPLLPVNILLGNQGSGMYRDKLVTPPDWTLSTPRPESRTRRLLIPGIPQFPLFAIRSEAADTQEKVTFTVAKNQISPVSQNKNGGDKSKVQNFSVDISKFPGWQITVLDIFEGNQALRRILHTRWKPMRSYSIALRADFYECPSQQEAQEFALKILANAHVGTGKIVRSKDVGDITYTWGTGKDMLFTRQNMVIVINNANRTKVAVRPLAEKLDDYITHFDQQTSESTVVSNEVTRTKNISAEVTVNRWRL